MNRKAQATIRSLMILAVVSVAAAVADEYEIGWFAVAGGGAVSTGGDLELAGTIGQPDAGAMSGADLELTGGFWALPPCWCLSDVNNDGVRNGEDIQDFVDCLLGAGTNCACADVETDGILDMDDLTTFVAGLIAPADCP